MTLMHEVAELRGSMSQVAAHARRADATLERIGRLLKGVADRNWNTPCFQRSHPALGAMVKFLSNLMMQSLKERLSLRAQCRIIIHLDLGRLEELWSLLLRQRHVGLAHRAHLWMIVG